MATTRWIRFEHLGREGFGQLDGDHVLVHVGSMFDHATATGEILALSMVRLLAPCRPTKVLALWNNFGELAAKLGLERPPEPLYFLKSPNSWSDPDRPIVRPAVEGKLVFEGELGIVIGRRATRVSVERALSHVFGYTCVNDVTLVDILSKDPSFPQWTRAKGFDSFCPFGPAVATGLAPAALRVRTVLDGVVRQDYPIADMRFPVDELVSRLSRDMTLEVGDIISCGTSVGAGSMKPGSTVAVEIEGIGKLVNTITT